MKFSIAGKKWTAKFYPAKKWWNRNPGCLGVTYTHKRRLEFPLKKLHFETVVHEVAHAYMEEYCLGNAVGLKKHQLEEAFCEMFSKYGYQLLGQARQIYLEYEKRRVRK